jgi:glutamate 5-kinase
MHRPHLHTVRRLVIKIGSRVVTSEDNGLDTARLEHIAAEVSLLCQRGLEVIIVSSGAVAAGKQAMAMEKRPSTIPEKQAAAAVGQPRLMRLYDKAFSLNNRQVAQLLLTADDLGDRQRFLNARATIDTLLANGIIPIINENDTVAVDEIKFGDNDNLSALVTTLVEGDLLLIMTDIEGFYDADPRTNPGARLIPLVQGVTREVEQAAGGSVSGVGTGGMSTKVAAAKKVGRAGLPTLMVNGCTAGIIGRALAGEEVGTLFLPAGRTMTRRKQWIAFTSRPVGRIFVDAGASKVLAQEGRSLLPSGITRIEGRFERGGCVRIMDDDGNEMARGITDYGSEELERIKGLRSNQIEETLGYRYGDEVIHRDNLVLL